MQTSKKILYAVLIMFGCTLAVSLYSWLMWQTVPSEIMAWVSGISGSWGLGYYAKSCVENKAKIEIAYLDERNGVKK